MTRKDPGRNGELRNRKDTGGDRNEPKRQLRERDRDKGKRQPARGDRNEPGRQPTGTGRDRPGSAGHRYGTERTAPTAREFALRLLTRIEQDEAYVNLALGDWLERSGLAGPDRGLATELVYGCLRHRLTLDWVIDHTATTPATRMPPNIRNILRLGVYQLLFLDRIPARAAVSEAVNLAKRFGHPGTVKLVNAVLRKVARTKNSLSYPDLEQDPVKHISVRYSHPEWMVRQWLSLYGVEGTIALCQANNQPPDLFLRCNTLRIQPVELARLLAARGIITEPSEMVPEGLRVAERHLVVESLPAFRDGLVTVQGEASILVGYAVRPQPGDVVVDCCSAPGGKTTHLAQLMQNRGRIYAFDIYPQRLALVRDTCQRLGVDIVEPLLADARELPDWLQGKADAVLVDAPCSGLGVLRSRPDARWRKHPADLEKLPVLQLEILQRAGDCVRPGGVLVYSTCSIAPAENGDVIKQFLQRRPEFAPESLLPCLPVTPQHAGDRQTAAAGWLQLLPHIHGTDGFFLCRLRKTDTGDGHRQSGIKME